MHCCYCYYIDFSVIYFSVSKADAIGIFRTFIKQLYDLRMSVSTGESTSHVLPELYIDNFDNEQIFQQLEMFNNHAVEEHRRAIKSVRASRYGTATKIKKNSLPGQITKHTMDDSQSVKKQVTFKSDNTSALAADADDSGEEEEEADVDGEESEEESVLQKLLDSITDKFSPVENEDIDNDDNGDNNKDSEATLNSDSSSDDNSDIDNNSSVSASQHGMVPKLKSRHVSAVDDRFFKLAEMEAFLDEQDLKEQRQHSTNARDTEKDDDDDDDDYDLSADDKVVLFSLFF